MGTEAESRLDAADAALTAFEAKRNETLAALKTEAQAVGDEYRAAHDAVEGQTRDAAGAVDETVIEPEPIAGTELGEVGG